MWRWPRGVWICASPPLFSSYLSSNLPPSPTMTEVGSEVVLSPSGYPYLKSLRNQTGANTKSLLSSFQFQSRRLRVQKQKANLKSVTLLLLTALSLPDLSYS